MILKGGINYYGMAIGVLGADSRFPKPPGHIKHAPSFDFPILYRTIPGATVERILHRPDDSLCEQVCKIARELESEGVRAITGSCGFLALFQQALNAAVNVPVYSSSLIQIPMVHHMLPDNKCIGVLTADKSCLTEQHLKAVGVENIPVVIEGLEDSIEFREVILEAKRDDMDVSMVEAEVIAAARRLLSANPNLGALVLECTDLPPYAHAIQHATGLPVFDLTTLTNMVYQAVVRKPYPGQMQTRASTK
ncbi:MAG: aspartate/glutamate racemase family protein [Proteobacteria bacterium]|nr:aspartate/glutamate racemase family protein [Pseudomonadota bacterium]